MNARTATRKKLSVGAYAVQAIGRRPSEEKEEKGRPEEHTHSFCEACIKDVINICINIMFLVGSICFLSRFSVHVAKFGDWLFIGGSALQFVMASESGFEFIQSFRIEWPDAEERDEFLETLNFWGASLIFMCGSMLFMPGLYSNEESEAWHHEVGSWLFICGSLGFAEANFWNAMAVAAHEGRQGPPLTPIKHWIQRLMCSGLYLTMFGAVYFTIGSFLYRPSYAHDCQEASRGGEVLRGTHRRISSKFLSRIGASNNLMPDIVGATGLQNEPCANTGEEGTYLYIVGSVCFLTQSLLKLVCTILQNEFDSRYGHSSKEKEKEVNAILKRYEEELEAVKEGMEDSDIMFLRKQTRQKLNEIEKKLFP